MWIHQHQIHQHPRPGPGKEKGAFAFPISHVQTVHRAQRIAVGRQMAPGQFRAQTRMRTAVGEQEINSAKAGGWMAELMEMA